MPDDISANLARFELISVILLNLKLKILKFVEHFFGYHCRISLSSANLKHSTITVRKITVCL